MTAPSYEVTCVGFYADRVPSSARLGNARFFISPLGLMLSDVLLILTPQGVRTLFPLRGVLNNDWLAVSKDGVVKTIRPARFPDRAQWAEFSEAACAAVDAKFPGLLAEVQALKILPPRDGLSAEHVPTTQPQCESTNHAC
jgi:hypothetical protein